MEDNGKKDPSLDQTMEKYLDETFPEQPGKGTFGPLSAGEQFQALDEAHRKTHIGNDEMFRRLKSLERPIF